MFGSLRRTKVHSGSCLAIMVVVASVIFSGCRAETENVKTETKKTEEHEIHEKRLDDPVEQKEREKPISDKSNSCSNPYYPIRTEIEREYKITGMAPARYVLIQKPRDKGGFTENRRFAGGMEVKSNWSCSADGLRNADYNNSVSSSNTSVSMETLESSGITIPNVWKVGESWKADYKIRSKMAGNTFDGTVTVESRLAALEENVIVQGGDFVAARVDSVIKINLSLGKSKIPSPDLKMTNWYARNFGLVKQEVTSQIGKSTVEYAGEK